jgi:hypothetical protein
MCEKKNDEPQPADTEVPDVGALIGQVLARLDELALRIDVLEAQARGASTWRRWEQPEGWQKSATD